MIFARCRVKFFSGIIGAAALHITGGATNPITIIDRGEVVIHIQAGDP